MHQSLPTRLIVAALGVAAFQASCGRSHNAVVEMTLGVEDASRDATRQRIAERLRAVGGGQVVEVKITPSDARTLSVAIELALAERCEGLGELRATLVESLTRRGRLGFHRLAGKTGRLFEELARALPEGALTRSDTDQSWLSSVTGEELTRAIAGLSPVIDVRLALEPAHEGQQRVWPIETPAAIRGRRISRAEVTTDEWTEHPVVALELDEEGATRFGALTASLVEQHLVIVVDGEVVTAPVVKEPIRGGRIQITLGGQDPRRMMTEAVALAGILSAPELDQEVRLGAVRELCIVD